MQVSSLTQVVTELFSPVRATYPLLNYIRVCLAPTPNAYKSAYVPFKVNMRPPSYLKETLILFLFHGKQPSVNGQL
jgi:hypothetical protein